MGSGIIYPNLAEKFSESTLAVQSLSHVWLCNLINCSTPDFLVLHYLPEFAQTHVHWVDNAIQPSHPLSPPSPLALNLSQHQGLFQEASHIAKGKRIRMSGFCGHFSMSYLGPHEFNWPHEQGSFLGLQTGLWQREGGQWGLLSDDCITQGHLITKRGFYALLTILTTYILLSPLLL